MKENMLDVIFYLFDNYPDIDDSSSHQKKVLQNHLQAAGFQSHEINRAFDWLEKLADEGEFPQNMEKNLSYRVFSPEEKRWINTECQGHLYFLEQAEILDLQTREQVINQIITLEDENFDLDKLKWVVLMVMINQKSEENRDFLWIDSVTTAGQNGELYH